MHPLTRTCLTIFTGLALTSAAFAQFGSPSPTYNYPNSVIQGNQPLVAGSVVLQGSNPITLVITQPVAPGLTYPLTVAVNVSVPSSVGANPGVPIGVTDLATVVGYCTLSSPTVTFANATSTASVVVSVNVPTPVISGNYFWKVATSGWPAAAGVVDAGAIINATVLPPVLNPTVKPTIVDLLPTNGSSFIYNGSTPVLVPISFTANSVSTAAGGASITTMTASFDSTPLSLTYPVALGATNPDGSFTSSAAVSPGITNSGPHTITVTARNSVGTTTAQTQINIFAPPSITSANATTFVYGQAGTFNVTATGYEAPTFAVSTGVLPTGVTLNPITGLLSGTPTSNAGSYPVTITATNGYGISTQNFILTVSPQPLTVTAQAASKIYGATNGALGYSITSGALVGADTLTGSLTRVVGENVGSYAISQGTLSAGPNYSLSYVGANFTILVKPITVTAAALSKGYGASDPAFGYSITSGSLVGSDALTGSLTRVAGENVGSYAITKGTLAASGNYALTFVSANLSIDARAITVTAAAKTKGYGDTDPALTYSITSGSLVGGDALTGALARATGESVATYAITKGTLTAGGNYNLTFVGASLSITARAITVTAAAKTKVFGVVDPALTYAITSGSLVGSDTLTGALTRVAGENVATYAINKGTLTASANYSLTYVGALLTITQAPQAIVFGTLAPVVAGIAPFAITATGGGSGNAVTFTSSNGAVATVLGNLITVIGAGSTVITANQAGNTNYTAAPAVTQTLTVTAAVKKNQTITFNALDSVEVGDDPFNLTATASSGLTVSYTSSNPAVASVSGRTVTILSAGTTTITATQAGNSAYNAAPAVSRTLTVTAVPSCPASILWLEPISLNKVRQGGSVMPLKFQLQECCGNTSRCWDWSDYYHYDSYYGWGCDDDDDGSHDDDHHTYRTDDHSGNNVSCRHGSNGRSTSSHSCRHDCDHDDDDNDGCANLRDKTVIISIYEVGVNKPAAQFKYGTGSANPPDYVIDGDYKYQLNFPTSSGKHTYHIDVYRFAAGSSTPVLVGSKEFKTK